MENKYKALKNTQNSLLRKLNNYANGLTKIDSIKWFKANNTTSILGEALSFKEGNVSVRLNLTIEQLEVLLPLWNEYLEVRNKVRTIKKAMDVK